ncbi:MAG: peptidoglycan-binding domain-containing protein, partial [Minisyncoccia bacterium]
MKRFLITAFAMFASPHFLFAQMSPIAPVSPTPPLTDQFTQVVSTCVSLQNNMWYKSRDSKTNGEVSDLQEFLISNSFLTGEPTGYFGVMTVAAVKKF